jgi:hypothetical protein
MNHEAFGGRRVSLLRHGNRSNEPRAHRLLYTSHYEEQGNPAEYRRRTLKLFEQQLLDRQTSGCLMFLTSIISNNTGD